MWGTPRSQPLTLEQQVQSIKSDNRFCQEYGPREYALGLRLKSTGLTCTVKMSVANICYPFGCLHYSFFCSRFPPQFPSHRPSVQVVLDGYTLTHPWLDANQYVQGSTELNGWQPFQPLGPIVAAIMRQFSSTAPTATQGAMQPGPAAQHYTSMPMTSTSSTTSTAAAFALGTFELVSREQGQSQGPHRLPAGGYPPPQGGMPPAGWPPTGTPSMQANPPQQWQQPPAAHSAQPRRQKAHTQMPPVPAYFAELDSKRLAELQVMDVDEGTRRAFLQQQESVKLLAELNTGMKQDNLTACLEHLDAEQVISAMQRDIDALRRTAQGTEEAVRALEARKAAVQSQGSASSLAQKLKAAAASHDRDSEQQMGAFIEGQEAPDASQGAAMQVRWLNACVSQYIESRTEHHKLLATAQLLQGKGFSAGSGAASGAMV